MKAFSDVIAAFEAAAEKQPRFVYVQAWNKAELASTFITSGSDAQTPGGADVLASMFIEVSGQTQKINPDIATSTIGNMSVGLLDHLELLTDKIGTKLAGLNGLRDKVGRMYVGYGDMPFSDYDLRVTQIVDSATYRDGKYKLSLKDIQRAEKNKIFSPHESTLNESISETDLVIPVTTADLTLFPVVEHGSEYTVHPGQTLQYAKIEKEVFAHSGLFTDDIKGPSFAVVQRGALNTRAVAHTVDPEKEDSRKLKIVEHIYLEGAAPKIIYALRTGVLVNQAGTLPDHWHLGIAASFVRLTDFQNLGDDLWSPTTDAGRFCRIENPGTQEGKRFIEKELLLWLGAYSPVYADGSIGIRRLTKILSDASYDAHLTAANVTSYGDLTHDMRAVINDIEVDWNWVDAKEDFTKTSKLIDALSIAIHSDAPVKKFAFKTVHTGLHTDNDILTYFDTLRDRYSGPPLRINVEVLPSQSRLEVGDTVRLQLDQVRDFVSNSKLDRVFEVQQVSTNWMNGDIKLSLFGSSQKAGELSRTTLSTVLNDAYYTQEGTELSTVLTIVAGSVTASATLTGHATDNNNAAAIYYYDGDLTIDFGVVISITQNVQLRIKGSLQINGEINGVGAGVIGGAATTQYKNGTTSYSFDLSDPAKPVSPLDLNTVAGGFFGTTITPANIMFSGAAGVVPHSAVSWNNYTPREYIGESEVPWRQLTNDNTANTLTGWPADLRGKSGISGYPVQFGGQLGIFGSFGILTTGGAGGNSGAGLLIIARGMAFGGAGQIDLSGGDSAFGTTYTEPASGNVFYGSAGAPGAPGGLMILLDGNVTNPDIDESVFIANYGDAPAPASAVEVGYQDTVDNFSTLGVEVWPYPITIGNKAPDAATENNSATASAHRFIYIPPDLTVQQEVDPQPADVTNFTVLQNGAVVVFKWDPNPDVLLAGFEIRYGPRGNTSFEDATPLTQVTKGTSITSADVPPGDWTFFNAGVNDSADINYSQNPATADLVVTAALDIIFQQAQSPDWLGTLTNFVKHHTGVLVPSSQGDNTALGWRVFDEFVPEPFEICSYEAPEIDISFDDDVRVWGSIESALGPGETEGVANPALSIDYRLSAGSYDGFENWSVGEVELRYCKHKLTLDTTKGIAKITDFKPTVDVLEHTLTGDDVTIAAGGSTITFDKPFHNKPFVRVFVDSASALIPTKENVTAADFDFNAFNTSGSNVGGTGSWEAVGS